MKRIQLFILLLMAALSVQAQTITFTGCPDLFDNNTFTFNKTGADATGRNIYETTPINGDQPCSGLGTCEFRIAWNSMLNRWEFLADAGNGDFADTYLVYYNTASSLPNPPGLSLGTWVENSDITGSSCGGNLSVANATLTGNIQNTPDYQRVLFVKKNASGNASGDSWENAMPELATALAAVRAESNSAHPYTEIWVAEGVYKPQNHTGFSPQSGGTLSTRDYTFVLEKNVKLYGGFAGTETLLSERNQKNHLTILSGDLDNDGQRSSGDAYHVLLAIDDVGSAVIDGFTITGGNADVNSGYTYFRNLYESPVYRYGGGGIHIIGSTPTIANCIFTNNYSIRVGGAAYIAAPANNTTSPLLYNVLLHRNSSDFYGGALYTSRTSVRCINVTITENKSGSGAGIATAYSGDISLYNSIVFNNKNNNDDPANLVAFTTGGTNAIYRIQNSYLDNRDLNWSQTGFANEGGNIESLNIPFADALNNDYSLSESSLAVNSGNNTLYAGTGGSIATDKDLNGNPRLYGTTVDIGAYEYQHSATLPITLIFFKAEYSNGQAILRWQSGIESNAAKYEIEKSLNAQTFIKAGETAAEGNNKSYTYAVPQTEPTAYYRLKMVDKDGSHAYSEVRIATFSPKPQSFSLKVFPNPVRNGTIRIEVQENTRAFIYDALGRMIKATDIQKGKNTLSLAGWANGVYFIRTDKGGSVKITVSR